MINPFKKAKDKKFYYVAVCDKCDDFATSEMPFLEDSFPCPCGGTFKYVQIADESVVEKARKKGRFEVG